MARHRIAAIAHARSAVTAYADGENLEVCSRSSICLCSTLPEFGFDRTAAGDVERGRSAPAASPYAR